MREDWGVLKLEVLSKRITKGATPTSYGFDFQNNGINFLKVENVKGGVIDVNSIRDFISIEAYNYLGKSQLESGDILFSIAGTIGNICLVKENILPANTNQAFAIIKGVYKEILTDFVMWQLKYFVDKIKIKSRGGAMMNVSLQDLKDFPIIICSTVEQRAIVKKLESLFSSLDAGVADLKKAQQQLKIYRQAVLKKAFEGELTNSEMELISLANLTTILGDGLHGTPKYSDSGEYYFINGNNLKEGKIILKPETKRVDKIEFEKYKKNLGNSTVLVSINGTIGNTAFYNNENVVLGKSACYFNLNDEIDKYYIRYNLTTKRFLHYAVNNATGSTIMNVGLKTMREYLVPVPKNRIEQNEIVKQIESRLSVCDSIEQNIKESLEKSEALRQSILKKAFEGDLLTAQELAECKQAADYEPANVLLERIKAEHSKVSKPKKKTKTT